MSQSKYIYITEPKDLDPQTITDTLRDSTWQAVPGDISFTNSQEHPYAAVLIRSNTRIDATVLRHFPQLKHIVRAGVGLDNVDLDFCKQHGITVYNAPGANADAVSDYTVGMMLFALRKLYKLTEADIVAWNRFTFTGQNMANQTIGIVGFGNIGKLLQRKLAGFNYREILIYDPFIATDPALPERARLVSLDQLLQLSTIISLHLPLTDDTNHLIGRHNLALVQEGAILINASRGGIVDETALLAVLRTKDMVYIADAVEGEPEVNKDLLGHPNIIITPHIASLTDESERNMVRVALQNLLDDKTAVIF